ncbi:hypothetical protein, partial [Heliomarina baculiformis]|uniref:hypothetical protein n=1 Tax=Heliomarina baculiformis TaxID=2872036 RepID=UPI001EE2DA97
PNKPPQGGFPRCGQGVTRPCALRVQLLLVVTWIRTTAQADEERFERRLVRQTEIDICYFAFIGRHKVWTIEHLIYPHNGIADRADRHSQH